MTVIDYGILHGRYESALIVYNFLTNKTLKTVEEYEKLAKKHNIRYYNY